MHMPEGGLAGWASSGAMALTGRSDGPPLAPPGDVIAPLRSGLDHVHDAARARAGTCPDLPGVTLLGERAAIAGLRRQGPWSCGGAFRTMPTRDGWFGLSLARPDDLELVPALVEADAAFDPWATVVDWAAGATCAEAGARAALLGLPHAVRPTGNSARAGVLVTPGGRRERVREQPLVLDLSALWAGPLAAHLLGLSGCRIVKVEDPRRPDGARRGPVAFFDLLHAGHEMISVDLGSGEGVARLVDLMTRADLVIEASRPRALRHLGIEAHELVENGTTWLSITARGRDSETVGFGDDVAVAAGLAVEDADALLPVGDAIADPLTGVAAAAAASRALLDSRASMIDVSMLHVSTEAVTGELEPHDVDLQDDGWVVSTSEEGVSRRLPVAPPRARTPVGAARGVGADNPRWLR